MGKTLVQLRESIRSWLSIDQEDNDERLPDTIANDLANWSIQDYLRRREHRFGEKSTAFQTVLYTPGYIYPVGFSRPRKLWYLNTADEVIVLDYLDKDEFDVKFPHSALLSLQGAGLLILSGGGDLVLEGGGSLTLSADDAPPTAFGEPTHYTLWEGKLVMGPAPNIVTFFFLDYYQILPAMEADDDTNAFSTDADQYIVFNSLANASLFGIEDERMPIWASRAEKLEFSLDLENSRMHSNARKTQSKEPG